jgi:hypothetical protein
MSRTQQHHNNSQLNLGNSWSIAHVCGWCPGRQWTVEGGDGDSQRGEISSNWNNAENWNNWITNSIWMKYQMYFCGHEQLPPPPNPICMRNRLTAGTGQPWFRIGGTGTLNKAPVMRAFWRTGMNECGRNTFTIYMIVRLFIDMWFRDTFDDHNQLDTTLIQFC